jgi:Domain of unknown function (DUF4349)
MTLRTSLFLVLATLCHTGCAASAPMSAKAAMSTPSPALAQERAGAAPGAAGAPVAAGARDEMAPPPPVPQGPSAPAKSAAAPKPTTDTRSAKNVSTRAPVIIYQGDLRMAADESAIPKTIDAIVDVAESLGGHLAGRKDASVVVKVPSGSFREAMTKIDAIGGVVSRSVTADDVSEEFHDLEVRLANLRATRTRLQEFLAKAAQINDMLTVERELERVAQEIDRIEGRLEFLRTRAAMSTISVTLSAKPKVAPIVVADKVTPSAQTPDLPIPWVDNVGLGPLMSLKKK